MPLKRPGTVLIIMCRTANVADECAGSMLYWSAASADAANASANAMMPDLRYRIDFCSLNSQYLDWTVYRPKGIQIIPLRGRSQLYIKPAVMRMLMSMAGAECVSAPTEM